MNLNDPATRQALATCLAMPYTGDPLVDERLDLIRALAAGWRCWKKAEPSVQLCETFWPVSIMPSLPRRRTFGV